MANVDLSIIIPSKNNKAKTVAVIKKLSEEIRNIRPEFIVIDMNSTDGGVLETLNVIKENDLDGCVIRSSGGTVASALNTGLFKATGKYITFVYPSRLYKNYLNDYYACAEEKNAEFVFAATENKDGYKILVSDGVTGADLAVSLIRSSINIDFTAVLFQREFLTEKGIRFYEECTLGYAEAFIYNVLLHAPKVGCSKISLERDNSGEQMKDNTAAVTKNCFERLEAMTKIFTLARELHPNDKVLLNAFEYQKLPEITMSCIDKLLSEGFKHSSIRKLMKSKQYDKYLDFSMDTSSSLRTRVILWKTLPWFYKPA